MSSTVLIAPSFSRMPSRSSRAFGLEFENRAIGSPRPFTGRTEICSDPAGATPNAGLTMRIVHFSSVGVHTYALVTAYRQSDRSTESEDRRRPDPPAARPHSIHQRFSATQPGQRRPAQGTVHRRPQKHTP